VSRADIDTFLAKVDAVTTVCGTCGRELAEDGPSLYYCNEQCAPGDGPSFAVSPDTWEVLSEYGWIQLHTAGTALHDAEPVSGGGYGRVTVTNWATNQPNEPSTFHLTTAEWNARNEEDV
jgi:hypothetical protein